jgi:hypothetical protein
VTLIAFATSIAEAADIRVSLHAETEGGITFIAGVRQHQLAQIALVRCAPSAAAVVTITVTKQKSFQPVTTAPPIIHRIASGPTQIANRFVGGLGNVDGGKFSSPQHC